MRGVPAWHRRRSVQHPSTVLALRANPPSPTRRGERKHASPQSGITAVAWISTLARSSTSAITCMAAMAGKCRPMTSR
ncbi:MAG: hypothetical protein EOS23_22145 [Mesorhizobium sp.]|nr:hypothetical protein EOA86_37170 [Mesorhizobium sp. M5C.F.Ca.IN.020.32.2.1]RUV77749.1 hypothetical protein EOA88_25805 [Mesorhizobium sp. M5C.F.Ca.IN.020.14.1.1]RWE08557.1 MAG: hypothetical protein EOS23_22145 [Mesorhizobium sp.]RWH55025.1 MAG: hypothetical protein EOQ82_16690 [Mesorhizobium sp.]RWI73822.1 MAG: hypothetical protein EOR18_13595 [Mesorhizobium sp.]